MNISTRSLLDTICPRRSATVLGRYDVTSRLLQLEITESRIVADLAGARPRARRAASAGVTSRSTTSAPGFSSLSQLQQLPVDEIKIDASFVMRMETDANDFVLVRSIVDLGRNLGLRVTAEGVESESVARQPQPSWAALTLRASTGRPRGCPPARADAGRPMPRAGAGVRRGPR